MTETGDLVLSNISVVDAGEYLLDVTYTFYDIEDNGLVTVIIEKPLCELKSISPSSEVQP